MIACVTLSSSSILNFKVPLTYIFRTNAMPLHSCPSDVLSVMKRSLLGYMYTDANLSMPIRKELVSNQMERGQSSASLAVPAKARNIGVVHRLRKKKR